jgi:hypothetical protein
LGSVAGSSVGAGDGPALVPVSQLPERQRSNSQLMRRSSSGRIRPRSTIKSSDAGSEVNHERVNMPRVSVTVRHGVVAPVTVAASSLHGPMLLNMFGKGSATK